MGFFFRSEIAFTFHCACDGNSIRKLFAGGLTMHSIFRFSIECNPSITGKEQLAMCVSALSWLFSGNFLSMFDCVLCSMCM